MDMNLFDLNNDIITMNIDGKDMEMRHPICYGKQYDKWLVSACGKLWSIKNKKCLAGCKSYQHLADNKRLLKFIRHSMILQEEDYWGDGSSRFVETDWSSYWSRDITAHKMILDTWTPLYDNPPVGVSWDEWKIARDLPTVFELISKTVVIDHKDDNPLNNHKDNLFRKTAWYNNPSRKGKGI